MDRLLLQQRSSAKITFPLVWTNTCCSHPLYTNKELDHNTSDDENSKSEASFAIGVRRAATRKLEDELGIIASDAPIDKYTFLSRIHYKAEMENGWGEHEIDYILFMKTNYINSKNDNTYGGDIEININPEEVKAVRYVDRDELRQLIREADDNCNSGNERGVKLSPWFRLLVSFLNTVTILRR